MPAAPPPITTTSKYPLQLHAASIGTASVSLFRVRWFIFRSPSFIVPARPAPAIIALQRFRSHSVVFSGMKSRYLREEAFARRARSPESTEAGDWACRARRPALAAWLRTGLRRCHLAHGYYERAVRRL